MQIVRMNIVMSYPVSWSKNTVLSNYVQNFFDALGPDRFAEGFRYRWLSDGTLVMESDNTFAKEWLYFIGSSTKREKNARTAGGIGEGFKIASLIALRDYHLDVTMESEDWVIHVTSVRGMLAGTSKDFLAYEISKRPWQDHSTLSLANAGTVFSDEMEDVLSDFYYKGNIEFGQCLMENDAVAIYRRADNPKTGKARKTGLLFAHYQRRAWISVPLVICNHRYRSRKDDRDRDDLSGYEITRCINDAIDQLSSKQSLELLYDLRSVWSRANASGIAAMDWTPVLDHLTEVIGRDFRTREEFRTNNLEKLLIRDTEKTEQNTNRRNMAMAWYVHAGLQGRYSFVSPVFRRLGIKTICELCEENDGFTAVREPNERERKQILMLRDAAKAVLSGLLVLNDDNWPACGVILNPRAPVAGYTRVVNENGGVNRYGMNVKAFADHVYLEEWLFQEDLFPHAFVVYAHELLHQFGGDSSLQFHKALRIMNERILENLPELKCAEQKWRELDEKAA